MDTLIAATVVIGDRSYRIRIEPKDEEVVRKTVKTINDKIIEFKTQFAGKDMQDYIAMVLVWFATEQTAGSAAGIEKDNIVERLDSIEKMLDMNIEQMNT
jgi:cell division protein ZapA (FtsZ GTPase activity inhibitor)